MIYYVAVTRKTGRIVNNEMETMGWCSDFHSREAADAYAAELRKRWDIIECYVSERCEDIFEEMASEDYFPIV